MASLIQLAFDWFDTVSADNAAPKRQESPPRPLPPARPPSPVNTVQPPVEIIADVLLPASFQHPSANREVLLGDARITYLLRRAKRRSIGFVVGPDGLVVSAPKWVPLYEVDAAVRDKSRWIVQKLVEVRERQQRQAEGQIEWKDGATLPYLGTTLTLLIDPTHAYGKGGAALKEGYLHVSLASTATPAQIRDTVQAWLMRQARALFLERLTHFAPQLGVQWQKLSLTSAKTRWGSASSSGAIRLNWRLIHFKPSVVDYVVVHELSHLREMNHSPRFWDTVEGVMPDYAALRKELKQVAVPRL